MRYINTSMNKGIFTNEQTVLFEMMDDIWGAPGSAIESLDTTLPDKLKQIETSEITEALTMHKSVAAASRYLGVGRTRLIARMKVLEIKGR